MSKSAIFMLNCKYFPVKIIIFVDKLRKKWYNASMLEVGNILCIENYGGTLNGQSDDCWW